MRTDRQRELDKKRYKLYQQKRNMVVRLLGGRCKCCGVPQKHVINIFGKQIFTNAIGVRALQLHHKKYHPTESNYPRHGRSMSARMKRVDEAFCKPHRFKLLCSRCHGRAHKNVK